MTTVECFSQHLSLASPLIFPAINAAPQKKDSLHKNSGTGGSYPKLHYQFVLKSSFVDNWTCSRYVYLWKHVQIKNHK